MNRSLWDGCSVGGMFDQLVDENDANEIAWCSRTERRSADDSFHCQNDEQQSFCCIRDHLNSNATDLERLCSG
jgi:hypothetical protein